MRLVGIFHREPEHFVSNKNKCTVNYFCPCVFFESFRRDLNEAKAVSCNVVNYLCICMYMYMYMYMCICICNWPLPIGVFQDQCKQIVINKHNLVKNLNWREADQLAIYKRRREVELGATENNIS